jgi:hypothetical protein
MTKHLEDTLQESCVRWFRYAYPNVTLMSIPNGGKRNAIEAAKLKRTGTLAGVADLFVMKAKDVLIERLPGELGRHYITYHGLWIEVKTGKNQQTEAQKTFEVKAIEAGYAYEVCRSIDEFMKVVNDYLT